MDTYGHGNRDRDDHDVAVVHSNSHTDLYRYCHGDSDGYGD